MQLRGKLIRLKKSVIWRDPLSGINLSQWGTGNDRAIIPEDPNINIDNIERAIKFDILELETTKKAPKKKVKKVPINRREIIGEPAALIRHGAKHIKTNVLGRCSIETLDTMLKLEAAGKNRLHKQRKTVIEAILVEMKKRGVNEAVVFDNDDKPIWTRKFDEEKGFPGEPKDIVLKKRTQDLKPE